MSQCSKATTDLAGALRAAGFEVEPCWVRDHRVEPTEAAPRAMLANRHLVARLADGGFIDVTRRQYETRSPHPLYYSSEVALAEHWREINDGPFDGPERSEAWRSLRPDLGKMSPWNTF